VFLYLVTDAVVTVCDFRADSNTMSEDVVLGLPVGVAHPANRVRGRSLSSRAGGGWEQVETGLKSESELRLVETCAIAEPAVAGRVGGSVGHTPSLAAEGLPSQCLLVEHPFGQSPKKGGIDGLKVVGFVTNGDTVVVWFGVSEDADT